MPRMDVRFLVPISVLTPVLGSKSPEDQWRSFRLRMRQRMLSQSSSCDADLRSSRMTTGRFTALQYGGRLRVLAVRKRARCSAVEWRSKTPNALALSREAHVTVSTDGNARKSRKSRGSHNFGALLTSCHFCYNVSRESLNLRRARKRF